MAPGGEQIIPHLSRKRANLLTRAQRHRSCRVIVVTSCVRRTRLPRGSPLVRPNGRGGCDLLAGAWNQVFVEPYEGRAHRIVSPNRPSCHQQSNGGARARTITPRAA
jgi:hypothetical protein